MKTPLLALALVLGLAGPVGSAWAGADVHIGLGYPTVVYDAPRVVYSYDTYRSPYGVYYDRHRTSRWSGHHHHHDHHDHRRSNGHGYGRGYGHWQGDRHRDHPRGHRDHWRGHGYRDHDRHDRHRGHDRNGRDDDRRRHRDDDDHRRGEGRHDGWRHHR